MDYNIDTLKSSIKFSHEKEDMFLGMNASIYETLKDPTKISMNLYFQKLLLIKIYLVMTIMEV